MSKPMIRIHNIETDEVIDREMNDEEYAQYQKNLIIEESLDAIEAQKEVDKAAAESKLAALGLTSDDLKALGL